MHNLQNFNNKIPFLKCCSFPFINSGVIRKNCKKNGKRRWKISFCHYMIFFFMPFTQYSCFQYIFSNSNRMTFKFIYLCQAEKKKIKLLIYNRCLRKKIQLRCFLKKGKTMILISGLGGINPWKVYHTCTGHYMSFVLFYPSRYF